MNVLLVNYEYPPLGGGAGNATAHVARSLAALGHRVSVLTSQYQGNTGIERESNGVELIRVRSPRRRKDRSNLFEMGMFVLLAGKRIRRIALDRDIQAAIIFFSVPCGPLGWWLERSTGIPYVVSLRGGDVPGTERGLDLIQRALSPVRRAVFRRSKAVIANSKGLAALSMAADPHPVVVIPNGIDSSTFRPAPPAGSDVDSPVTLLFVGRLHEQKNLHVLLEQFASARRQCRRDLRLVMVGDGPQRESLHEAAVQLGLGDRIEWRGWMDRRDLAAVYRQANIFINPSLYEGMPNTVMEAMASGLPVIASNVAGNSDLIDHDRNGLLFELDAPGALSHAIIALAQDDSLRETFSSRARQLVLDRYSWSTTAQQHLQLFEQGDLS